MNPLSFADDEAEAAEERQIERRGNRRPLTKMLEKDASKEESRGNNERVKNVRDAPVREYPENHGRLSASVRVQVEER